MTTLDSYGPEFTMLLIVLLVLVGLTERMLSVTQQSLLRFQLAGVQAFVSYLLILDAQLICGMMRYISDGVLRVGFVDDFYSASVWWSAPRFDRTALIAELLVVSVVATLYALARLSPRCFAVSKRDRR